MNSWKFLLEFHRISDQDIKEIIRYKDEGGKWHKRKHTPSSDDARRAILKIYTFETPIPYALNNANMCRDRNAIKTLGPFSCLLYYALDYPPKENKEVQKKNLTKKKRKRMTLYRGLGLPE